MRLRTLIAVLLLPSFAHAEGVGDARNDLTNPQRVYGVATLLPTATGLIAIGGPALRRLKPGARRWDTLHTVAGDNLYRVSADETGRLLASWSKEPWLHLIAPEQGARISFPKPPAPAGVQNFELSDLKFAPDGRHALLFMSGSVKVTTGPNRGPSGSTSIYRVALQPNAVPTPVARVDHAYRLHTSRFGAVFALNKYPGRGCGHQECLVSSIAAYEVAGDRATVRTLLAAEKLSVSRVRGVRAGDDERVALILDSSTPRTFQLLRWRYGETTAALSPLASLSSDDRTRFLLTKSGQFLELKVHDGFLEILRHDPRGPAQLANVKELLEADTGLYAAGEREDGTLYWHYGDHLGLLSPGQPPRGYHLKGLLPRRAEWTGIVYAKALEQLWLGIDTDSGRHYVKIDFADVVKGAKPWPAGTLIERTHGEYAGYTAKDPSTADRLANASTLRPMPGGGLFSIGGAALRRMSPGASRWETLHVIPGDNLYRVASDPNGRLIAAWEKDPNLHVFPPGAPRYSIPKPMPSAAGITMFQVDELYFSPDGRDALVVMDGQVKSPPHG